MIFLRLCCVRMYAAFCHERRYIGRMLTGRAYIWGRESRQVKSAKNLIVDRNSFTESRCSEQRTGITKKCASARFQEVSCGSVKSIIPTCGQNIMPPNLIEFRSDRIFHHTAKSVCQRVHRLCCYHFQNQEERYEHQK